VIWQDFIIFLKLEKVFYANQGCIYFYEKHSKHSYIVKYY